MDVIFGEVASFAIWSIVEMISSFAGGPEAAGTDCTNEHKVPEFVNSKFIVASEGDSACLCKHVQSPAEMNSSKDCCREARSILEFFTSHYR